MTLREDYDKLIERLKTERDELNVRMHLANAELRDEWQTLEKRWDQLKLKGEHLRKASGESAESVSRAAQQLGQELKDGYQRLRRSLH